MPRIAFAGPGFAAVFVKAAPFRLSRLLGGSTGYNLFGENHMKSLAGFIDLGEELASMNALRSDTRMGGPSDAFQAGRGDGARRIGQTKHRPRSDVDRREASATPGR